MNPRTFCREGTYESAVCVTYSFDPIFFERVVLHDLWSGGSRDVLIIADAAQACHRTPFGKLLDSLAIWAGDTNWQQSRA